MKNLENLLNRAENTLNGNFREDLIEAVKWALHFEDFQSKIDNNGNLIIASDEQENEVLECIFDDSEVQEVISKIERTTKNLGLFKRSKGSETAPSEQFAKKMINYFIEEYNLEKSGFYIIPKLHQITTSYTARLKNGLFYIIPKLHQITTPSKSISINALFYIIPKLHQITTVKTSISISSSFYIIPKLHQITTID